MPRRPGATRRTPSRIHRGYPGTTATGDGTTATARKGRRPTTRGKAARGTVTTATTVTTTRARTRGSTGRDPVAAPTAGAGRCAAGPADRLDPHRRPVAVLRGVVDRQRLRRRPGPHERGCAPFVLGPIGRARGNGAPLARPAPGRSSSQGTGSSSARLGGATGRLSSGCSGRARRCICRHGGVAATTVPAVWVGQRIESAPAVRVGVTAAGRRLATVSVSAPAGQALLDRVKRTALAVTGDELALTRGGVVVAGPAALRGARLGADGRLQSGGDALPRPVGRAAGLRPAGRASLLRPMARLPATIQERYEDG